MNGLLFSETCGHSNDPEIFMQNRPRQYYYAFPIPYGLIVDNTTWRPVILKPVSEPGYFVAS
jgi:hypothetical protein